VLRRLARHLGVDLDAVVGSGPGGRVTRTDVERHAALGPAATAAAPPPASPAPGGAPTVARDRDATMRRAIAALMARSAREVPQYHLRHRIDLGQALPWLEAVNADRPPRQRLVPAALLLKAVAAAARATPALNGFWRDDAFVPSPTVDLGVAVSLRRGGLLVPTIHDAPRRTLDELMEALRDLVERARAGRLRASELAAPSITVTNLGDTGVDVVHGLVYPPQVALVGFGRIHPEAWAAGGMVGERPVVHATLAGDHRASDGIQGARLLAAVDRLLQHPDELRGGDDGS
jgi:pyruvate dehydrogenase E2 component (dihydrolipoamide acetyltransferase)